MLNANESHEAAPIATPSKLQRGYQAIKPYLPALLMCAAVALGSEALAQTQQGAAGNATDAIKQLQTNLSGPLCQVYGILTGWFTILLIVTAVAIGGLMKLFGSRNWSGMIIGALVAGAIVMLSGTIVRIVISNAAINCGADVKIASGLGTDGNNIKAP